MEKQDLNELTEQEAVENIEEENTYTKDESMDTQNTKYSLLRAFVAGKKNNQEKADVYEKKFRKLDEGRLSWNWCAFLVTPCWLLYRKLYKWFFIYMGIGVVISGIFGALGSSTANSLVEQSSISPIEIIELIISIILCVVVGLFGDKIYKAKLENLIHNGYTTEQDISKYGGTNTAAVLIYIGVCALAVIAVATLFVTAYMMLGGEELLYL